MPANSVSYASFQPSEIPLPYEADLREVLAPLGPLTAPASAVSGAPVAASAKPGWGSSFYFLDESRATGQAAQIGQQVAAGHPAFDVHALRRDFPILQERVNGRQLIWLDNAATTQKPQSVIDRLAYFYQHENSNIHRAAHELAARATDAYEEAREKSRNFINAGSVMAEGKPDEIIYNEGVRKVYLGENFKL